VVLYLTFHIQVVIKNVVTCLFLRHSVVFLEHMEQLLSQSTQSSSSGAHGAEHTEYCFFIYRSVYMITVFMLLLFSCRICRL